MSYENYPEFDDYQQRWSPPKSYTSLTSILLAFVLGALALFNILSLLGCPVWLWIHHLAYMSAGVLRRASLDTYDSESSDDTMLRSGGILGSIFGLNPVSLLQKGVRGVVGALSMGSSDVPPGLGNISNSCYQNSIIQGLASLPSLRDYLSKMAAEHPSLTTETTNGALHDMISKLNDPNNHGQHFWIRGKLKSMSTSQQQDAQEYYSKVLDALDEEVKKASRSSVSWLEATKSLSGSPDVEEDQHVDEKDGADGRPSPAEQSKIVPNPLDGLLAQRVGCVSCGYSEGLSLIPFNCVTVSLGRNSGYDIRECLDEYTTLEYIDGVECAKCTLLKMKNALTPLAAKDPESFEARLSALREALEDEDFEDKTLIKKLNVAKKNWVQSRKSKQAVIARAPKSLVLHVNRSGFNEMTGLPFKNSANVSYPQILNLGSWCLGSQPSGSQHPDMSMEEWPKNPKKSMLLDTHSEAVTTSPFLYKLRAAVTHYGSHGSGHYVCYRPHPRAANQSKHTSDIAEAAAEEEEEDEEEIRAEQWWRFSDDSVYVVSEGDAHQGNVFMLFYERMDEPTSQPGGCHAVCESTAARDKLLKASLPNYGERDQPISGYLDDDARATFATPKKSSPHAEPIAETLAVPEDAPLPPAGISVDTGIIVDDAAEVPLPDDEDLLDLVPPESPALSSIEAAFLAQSPAEDQTPPTISAYPTPPPDNTLSESTLHDTDMDTEISEAESEDAPSTQLTSDYESEADIPTPPTPKTRPIPPVSPHLMRTAGNTAARGQGSRQILPLVSAT